MKIFILAALVAVVAAETYKAPAYPTPAAYPAPSYPAPAYKTYEYPAQPYSFSWAVKDDPSYNDYAQSENSDGKVVAGSYRVLLPDGRTQTVTYKVDGYSGYVADVKYDGYAKYPEYKPAAYKAVEYKAPEYKAPAYPAKY